MMKRTSRLRARTGFTMVELMIVVVLVGVVAAMASPGLQKAYERMKYKKAVRNITSSLRLARSNAVTMKQQVAIEFNSTAKTVTMFIDRVNPGNYALETGDSVLRRDTLPREVAWMGTDCANNVLAFEPNGSSGFSGGGNIYTIAYTQDMIAFHSSTILASTGRVATNYYFY